MATSSSTASASSNDYLEAIREGQKLIAYLYYDAAELDATAELDAAEDESLQIQGSKRWHSKTKIWDERVEETDRARITLGSISKALESIRIGRTDFGDDMYMEPRTVNSGVFPRGRNIPITLYTTTGAIFQWQYELIYNVVDGVIVITHVQNPRREELVRHSAHDLSFGLPSLLGAVFTKLHTTRTSGQVGELPAATRDAKRMVKEAIDSNLPLPALPRGVMGSWLPATANCVIGLTARVIEQKLRRWLNYVVVHVSPEHNAHPIIRQCLRDSGVGLDITRIGWDSRQEYKNGQS